MQEPETTLCTAVEAGPLEQQVIMLADSLRHFGGAAAGLPFFAVKPRSGAPVSRAARTALDKLGVTFIDKNINVELAWWAHANKAAVLDYTEKNAGTPNVTWIDGDMMVLREPQSFAPPSGFDFIARAGEGADVASNGSDGREVFWQKLCAKMGMRFDDFPDMLSFPEKRPIKAYWQAGLFTYRRETQFADTYRQTFETLLSGDIASKLAGTYHVDQVSLALAVQKHGLRAAEYDPRMNFNMNPLDKAGSTILPINEVLLLQYHGSLWPKDYEWAMSMVKPLPADRVALLERYGPLQRPKLATALLRKLYQYPRARRIAAYEAQVVRY